MYICEYFCAIEQQGPGGPEVTIKALHFIDGLNEKSQIADIGCGTGTPTMILAKNTKGQITGIDYFLNLLIFSTSMLKNSVCKIE